MPFPKSFCMKLLDMLLLLLVVAAKLETSGGCINQPKLEQSFQLGADISATILTCATDLKDRNDCDENEDEHGIGNAKGSHQLFWR